MRRKGIIYLILCLVLSLSMALFFACGEEGENSAEGSGCESCSCSNEDEDSDGGNGGNKGNGSNKGDGSSGDGEIEDEDIPTGYDESGFTGTTNQTSLKLETDSFITIDGKLQESCYENQKWFTYTFEGVQISVTTVFGDKGFYIAFKVKDPQVYGVESRSVWMGSSVEVYIDRGDSINKSAQTVQYRLSALNIVECLKGVETLEDRWKWTYRPIYGLTTVNGEINSGNTEGLDAEIFVRWDALGYDTTSNEFVKPDKVKIMPVYNQSSGKETDSARAYWCNNGGEINEPTDYWVFGTDGYINADREGATIGDGAFGRGKTPCWDISQEASGIVKTNIPRQVPKGRQVSYFSQIYAPEYIFTTLVKYDSRISSSAKAGVVLGGKNTIQSFLIDYSSNYMSTSTSRGMFFNVGNPDPRETWSMYDTKTLNIDPTKPIRLTGVKVGNYMMIFIGDENTAKYGGTLVGQIEDNQLLEKASPGLIAIDCNVTYSDFEATTDPEIIASKTEGNFSMLKINNQTGGKLETSATGYRYGSQAVIDVTTTNNYKLTSLKVDGVESMQNIVDGRITVTMNKSIVRVEPTYARLGSVSKGSVTAQISGTTSAYNYQDVEVLLTNGTDIFVRTKLTTASQLKASMPYGTYNLVFFVRGAVNSTQSITVDSKTKDLGSIVLDVVPGGYKDLPTGGSYNEATESFTLASQTNYQLFTYTGGFEFGVSLNRTDGEKNQDGTWKTGGVSVLAGGNMYRIFIMREGNGIVVYLNNETNWAQAEYRQGGQIWGTGAPITFDVVFAEGKINLLINKSIQYSLTKNNAKTYEGVTYTIDDKLNYIFDASGTRTVGICSIDNECEFRNITSQEVTSVPTMYTVQSDMFTDNNETAKISDTVIGLGKANSKLFKSGANAVETTGSFMVSFTAHRADYYVQEGTWDTYGLYLEIGGVGYKVFFMRENYGSTVIYLESANGAKEYRINSELKGTGAEMTLTFIYVASEQALHIQWGADHIKLNASTLGGSVNDAVFSNTNAKSIGVFANVSTVFQNLKYSLDSAEINDALSIFGPETLVHA